MIPDRGPIQRRPLIAGNWKMYKKSSEAAAFIGELSRALGECGGREVIVAPPFTALARVVAEARGTGIGVAAQNVFWEAEGAFTGEVSAPMLADLGVAAVIVGHSERRQYFGETDEAVQKKVRAVLDAGLIPIMCVGETAVVREGGMTEEVLEAQVDAGLGLVGSEEMGMLAIAYEPVWAIGTGRTADADTAAETVGFLRDRVREVHGQEVADRVRILYGGSVNPGNIAAFMAKRDIDGALVGGASLDPDQFAAIIRYWI